MAKNKSNQFDTMFQNVETGQSSGAFAGIATVVDQVAKKTKRRYGTVPLDRLRPNPNQPRKTFNQEGLEELGDSIVACGLLEPIVVREADNGFFDIACGERRWRAMQLRLIPEADAVILEKGCSDYTMEQIALAENVQRVDLTPYELALAYERLQKDEQGNKARTLEEVATIAKKSLNSIDAHLAILRVPPDVRQLIIDKPDVPLRVVRDLGNVENERDRAFLMKEVQDGTLTSNAVTRILQLAKQQQKTLSAYAEKKKQNKGKRDDQNTVIATQEAPLIESGVQRDVHKEEPSKTALKRPSSPIIALATLEEKLVRDSAQIRKITDRIMEEMQVMGIEERKCLRQSVDQWRIIIQQILDATVEEEV